MTSHRCLPIDGVYPLRSSLAVDPPGALRIDLAHHTSQRTTLPTQRQPPLAAVRRDMGSWVWLIFSAATPYSRRDDRHPVLGINRVFALLDQALQRVKSGDNVTQGQSMIVADVRDRSIDPLGPRSHALERV